MIDVNRLCAGCMREKKIAVDVCPYCGFSLSDYQQNTRCLAINTILAGKYLVGKVLGQGGFGITYMGLDLNMETRVAIKEYFPVELVSRDTTSMTGDRVLSLSGDKRQTYQQGLEKYVKEAQNVSQFTDIPGVVSVKDFLYENETAYIVMEYIDGMSLKDYLVKRGGRLPEAEALAIVKPVLEALVKVHKAGMIHRDISPDNIMLTFEEGNISSVKLIDFGAARMTAKNDQKSLTIILKHGYAPEEQYRTHGEQGPWTDVYAICAVLYRMLTGETPVAAMDRLFEDGLKDFSDYSVKVRKSTADAVMRGLAVKKEERFSSVSELIGALYEGKAVKKTKTHKTALIAGVAAAGVAVAAGIFVVVGAMTAKSGSSTQLVQEAADGQAALANIELENDQGDATTESAQEVILSVQKETVIGETIVERSPQTVVSTNVGGHTLLVMPDGTVQASGRNDYGQCMVQDWDHIAAVSASHRHSLGLRTDGTVVARGYDSYGECSGVDGWTDIVAVAAGGMGYTSFGLRKDGTVAAVGRNLDGCLEEIAQWTDITAICSPFSCEGLIGLDSKGTVHYAGVHHDTMEINGWEKVKWLIASSTGETIFGLCEGGSVKVETYNSTYYSAYDYSGMENWTEMCQVSITGRPILGVHSDGTVAYLDKCSDRLREVLESWTDMEAVIATNDYEGHVIGLRRDGSILEYYGNYGNCELEDMKNLKWIQVMDSTSADNLVAGTQDGRILTWGQDEFRVSDLPERFELADENIVGIAGINTVLTKDGTVWLAGDFIHGDLRCIPVSIEKNVRQALEVWDKSYEQGASYGYVLLKTDGTVEVTTFCLSIKDNRTGAVELVTPEETLKETGIDTESWQEVISEAENWSDIVQIVGDEKTLFGLRDDGTVLAVGTELEESVGFTRLAWRDKLLVGIKDDQSVEVLSFGQYDEIYGRTQLFSWNGIVDLAIGESHIVGLREDGTVIAAGCNHLGQCEVDDWTDIVYLTAGRNCTLGITSDGELKIAGSMY
ncbi:MAG: protein kinase [Clostridiales bacterium]|nr:protein kinase [Clostridiales bacterium]